MNDKEAARRLHTNDNGYYALPICHTSLHARARVVIRSLLDKVAERTDKDSERRGMEIAARIAEAYPATVGRNGEGPCWRVAEAIRQAAKT